MKNYFKIFALTAAVLSLSSCSQEDDPKYHAPTPGSFTLNTPAFQDQPVYTSGDMTDVTSVTVYANQPDYGFAAAGLTYQALVSLEPECPDVDANVEGETPRSVIINSTSSNGQMTFKTYDLAVAACQLLAITDEAEYAACEAVKSPMKLYLRGICSIDGMDGSRVTSANVVSFNKVHVVYAVPRAAWIYVCGNVQTLDGFSMKNGEGFQTPSEAFLEEFMQFALYEQEIGSKIFIGTFNILPKSDAPDLGNPDDASQWRYFTELLGWVNTASIGSAESDFYCKPITSNLEGDAIYSGDAFWQGLGNWGIHITEPTPVTMVVDGKNYKVWFREGVWDVEMVGGEPNFVQPLGE